ncbi:glycosyltransferase [Rubrivirga sp. S365]|uniref:Glycosyltransferase n=1 Tax=Rubrivirga litoralis TaxID=3075598 RepID=A0ABU3BR67_9BACT|nr:MULTISPECIES: glycosyltransferase [unclassified Rubrivirga]MDT0631764.1 glycosyltransferase [Rubrivirga sp. F394]MDT7856071.1 glycosyltransferase [Rubrivirga sp. S365]
MPDSPAPLGVVHGYGLAGAGSNLWTRAVLRALAQGGHAVHAVCQESRPERYDFVSKAVAYGADGHPEILFERETDYPGAVTVHRPALAVLPTYVRPSTPSDYVVYIPDLDDAAVEGYLARNAAVLERVAREAGVAAWVVNHTVLMAPAAHRARGRGGAPYAVLPHGSAIEYVVKREDRSRRLAEEALGGAAAVFALNGEMEGRIRDVFGSVEGVENKLARMPVGTDTSVFELVDRADRAATVERIAGVVAGVERGRPARATADLHGRLAALGADPSDADVLAALEFDYPRSAPDADVEAGLRAVDWDAARTVVYVGRLIAAKGPADLVLALPLVAEAHPDVRAIVAGTGGLREGLEALVWALSQGDEALVRQLVRLGGALEGGGGLDAEPFFAGQAFLDALDAEGGVADYVATAARTLTPEHVVFTGFLDHDALGPLYGLADAGAFPSVVREASPLVVPESAAAGVLPVGPDVGGMGDSLRALAAGLPEPARPLLLTRPDAEHRVSDLADRLTAALDAPGAYAADLRREAEARFDWRAISERLADALHAVADAAPPA